MNRRSVLAGAGSVFIVPIGGCLETVPNPLESHRTGCSDSNSASVENAESEQQIATGDESLTTVASISIESYDSPDEHPFRDDVSLEMATPCAYGLEIGVEIVTAVATIETPARVAISVTNTSDRSQSVLASTYVPTRENYPRTDSDSRLFLYSSDTTTARSDDECLKTRAPRYIPSQRTLSFDPGESIRQEYELWGHYEDEQCFPAGEYVLPQFYNVPEEPVTLNWAISIELS